MEGRRDGEDKKGERDTVAANRKFTSIVSGYATYHPTIVEMETYFLLTATVVGRIGSKERERGQVGER